MPTPPAALKRDAAVARAAELVLATDDETLRDQIELTAVPAPPFAEEERAAAFTARLPESLAERARTDAAGNVVALREGEETGAPVVLSAHLDTVFEAGTDVTVHREGNLLRAPGISDDGRGLAAILAVARALDASGVRTRRPILVVATVGEEGAGDLRGARHLVGPEGAGAEASAFLSIDGAGVKRIVSRGLGSRRLRLTLRGPGGHSWIDYGTVNPIHALARGVSAALEAGGWGRDAASLTVARWGGGRAINAIPAEAWIEVDLRSGDAEALASAEQALRGSVDAAVRSELQREGGKLEAEVTLLGDRPAGATDPDDALVRAAMEATRAIGVEPRLEISSTDANAAMAVGIPAVTLGGGGEAGGVHTTEEWYRNAKGPEGVLRALYTVLLAAGVP